MTLNRWSLHQLVLWLGMLTVIILFVPTGFYLMSAVASSAERSLGERGESLGRSLASQITEPLLLGDRAALHDALRRSLTIDSDVRYFWVADSRGEVIEHTFSQGFPRGLLSLRNGQSPTVVRYRSGEGPLMDVCAPILSGQLGNLHVGMYRGRARDDRQRLIFPLVLSLVVALLIVVFAAHLVAIQISRPLRQLESQVSRFPKLTMADRGARISGTREVESLAAGFAELVERLEALEAERVVTQNRMIQAERLAALGELSAGLAHEIHNPLDGMLECVRYLDAAPHKDERAARYLPMLHDGLQRIACVMRQMLNFARSGQGTASERCSVSDLVRSLLVMFEGREDTGRVHLTCRSSGPCECMCNRQELSQVILNLMLNAVDATRDLAVPEVLIEATCDPGWVYLTVEDNGPGVGEGMRERIFDPFVTTKPAGKGTGLGLSVSRQMVRAVGGDLEVSGQPSRLGGACFIVRLPRVPGQEVCNG